MSGANVAPMSSPTSRRSAFTRRWQLIAWWAAGSILVLAVVAIVAGKMATERYLRSDRFRQFVGQKTSETLHATGEFAPFSFADMSFYTESFQAVGSERSAFSELRLDQLRADVSTRRFAERVWQVEQVSVQRLDVKLDGPRAPFIESSGTSPLTSQSPSGGWLPNRVEIGSATIHETNLTWSEGVLRGTRLSIMPYDGGWNIAGEGGRISQAGLPPIEVASAQLRYRAPTLFVQSADLRQSAGGTAQVTGEVRPGESYGFHAVLAGLSVTPLLAPDWRVRLHGNLSGEIDVRSQSPAPARPSISGKVTLSQGLLEALPVLDQIASFTRLQQFRRLPLSKASAEFRQENGRLDVQDLIAESDGLIRIEGGFSIVNEMIEGSFSVGVTPSSLQWLPGSQERVFTAARGGYVWTPVRLFGPVAKPMEDLSPA